VNKERDLLMPKKRKDEDDMHATSIFPLPFFNKAAKKKNG
jgi:hypothetical protein